MVSVPSNTPSAEGVTNLFRFVVKVIVEVVKIVIGLFNLISSVPEVEPIAKL